MAKNILYETFGYKKARWIKIIILGIFISCLWFAGAYSSFFGNFLTWSYTGVLNIPAKIFAILFFIIAWDSWNT